MIHNESTQKLNTIIHRQDTLITKLRKEIALLVDIIKTGNCVCIKEDECKRCDMVLKYITWSKNNG